MTDEQKNAIRRCRFVTVDIAHTKMIAVTPDIHIAGATGCGSTAFQPEAASNKTRIEYEIQSFDPEVVRFAQEVMVERAAREAA